MTTDGEHSIYGLGPLSRRDQDKFFGPGSTHGVVHTNGTLVYVFVKMGASAKYINYISRDTLLYCWPSFDGADRRAMQRAYDLRAPFLVKVVPHGSTRTFLWGRAIISEMESSLTEFESEGVLRSVDPGQRRYKITRISSQPLEGPPEDAPLAIPHGSTNDAAPAQAQAPSPPASEAMGGPIVPAREVMLDGIQFDSVCEARHYITMQALGLKVCREPLSINITSVLPGEWPQTWYNPDVLVTDPYKGTVLIEIKPCYPYDEEIVRCEAACRFMRLPVILFYGTDFRSPYEITRPPSRSYEHSHGPRGIQWNVSPETGTVIRVDDVAYMADEVDGTTVGFIDRRRDSQDMRVYHPRVIQAFETARQRVV